MARMCCFLTGYTSLRNWSIVNDPDPVLKALTREVREIGPHGKEVTKVVPAISGDVKEALVRNIRRRMTPQPFKIRADIEMKCFDFDSVIHIKVSERDDKFLAEQMAKLRQENAKVSGDEDSEVEEDTRMGSVDLGSSSSRITN